MKECMHQNIVNEAEEYASIHKNINENEPDDPNDTKLDENTVAYVSDTRVSKEWSDLRGSYIASRPVERLEPTLKGQSYNNALAHKVKNMDGNI